MADPQRGAIAAVFGGGDEGGHLRAQFQSREVDPIGSMWIFEHERVIAVAEAEFEL